ncbi:MAG: inorganic diphosphatase [Bacillota bacterium]
MPHVLRPPVVDALIEIPMGSQNKYEHDKESGYFRLDRVLYSPIHYPADYGYVPQTLAEDGDPLDILVMITVPTFPGCVVPARVVGAMLMEDDKGRDTKLLAVCNVDPRFEHVSSLDHLGNHTLREVEHFFSVYKSLEGKPTHTHGWRGLEFAVEELERTRQAYLSSGGHE